MYTHVVMKGITLFFNTSEDQSLLRIVLVKSHREASNCWKSLLESQYEGTPWELDQMEKKLTLERFQNEVGWNTDYQVQYSQNCDNDTEPRV